MKILLIILSLLILGLLLRPVYHEPRVVRNFISHETCDYIMEVASKKLTPSTVSSDKVVNTNVRQSETAWLSPNDPIIREVMEKCTSNTDRPLRNCEHLQVLRYQPGGFYKPHQDCFKNDKNKRMYTCIIALTDDFEGGETEFPNLKKIYKLKKGDMLFFNTLDDWGRMTPKALHGGRPVTSGEKWICNVWIRTYPWEN